MTTLGKAVGRNPIARPIQYLALLAYMCFLGFPLVFLLTTAFKTPRELRSPDAGILPQQLNLDNFTSAIEKADLYHGEKLIRRGRPPVEKPKQAISLRVDADVLDYFKASGPGWQSRMNEALRKASGL